MKIIVEFEFDDSWTPQESEQLTPTEILNQAVTVKEGIRTRIINYSKSFDNEYDHVEFMVCAFTGITPEEIRLKKRDRLVVETRQICHYIARKNNLGSLASIGLRFGNKRHDTVIHSVQMITELLEVDKEFKSKYQQFIESFLIK